jgi:G3E family GTPase
MADLARVPVTVLTGFLGSGKTTLLNRILTEHHGQRIAVIENEFGEIGIDQALVIRADEETFEMNNGCICCTVRGDLIRVLGNLMKRRDKFDRVLVETTGMANPGPVAQTFFVDDDVKSDFRLDGIITLVDAKHLDLHLGHQQEAHEQVAFADVIIVNKVDLVTDAQVASIERRLHGINAMAKVVRGTHADVPLGHVLDVGGFDLDRALSIRPSFLEPEYPFEWVGVYQLDAGHHVLHLQPGPDPTMRILVEPIADGSDSTIGELAEHANRRMVEPATRLDHDEIVQSSGIPFELVLQDGAPTAFRLSIAEAGRYAVFTQHLPAEFELALVSEDGRALAPFAAREFVATHTHDDAVTSVGIELEGAFDEARLHKWLGALLREKGNDIFRMKGILAIAGSDKRFVFQGVHMLFDGRPDRPWGDDPRRSQVVFIGKALDRDLLHEGLSACLA